MRPTDPRVLERLRPARAALGGVVASGILGSLLIIVQAWVVSGLVVAVLHGRGVAHWAAFVVSVTLLRAAVSWAGDLLAARAASVVGTSLRRQVVDALIRRPEAASTGAHSVLATRGVAAAEPYLTRYLPALVLAAVLPALTLVVIATQDLLSALIVVATLPLVPVFGALVGMATRDKAQRQWRAMASLSGHFLDVVRGLPTLVAHRRAEAQSRRIAEITDRYRAASSETLRLAFASSAVLELVATLSVALVAVTVGVRLADGAMALGPALFVLLLAPEAYWPLRRVGAEFHAAAEGVATFEAVAELVDSENPPARGGAAAAPGQDLEVHDLRVLYPGRRRAALEVDELRLSARGVTAVTGPSGCGKSTLLAVLADLLPAGTGEVTCAGRAVGGAAWQAQVAWLPQRPLFWAGSVAENLRMARPDATEDQLWASLRRVALEERVRLMPLGLEEPLEEDGRNLSAGERARLALARVVLADRPWTFLDEPTAHLDPVTEQVIADAVRELGRRGAVVMVAHRPTLIELADHHVELAGGPAAGPPPVVAATPGPGPTGEEPSLERDPDPDPGPTSRVGFGLSTLLGASASASGVALTATAGWLIVQAAGRPPFLTLLVAVVGVRAFGLARPVLRYAERIGSHDLALRLLARRRVEVYDALVPLTPAALGQRRGDVLATVVDDVDSVVDEQLRVRMPVRSFVLVALAATSVAAVIHPPAAVVTGVAALLGGAGAWRLARTGSGRGERAAVSTRAELSTAVVESVQTGPELVMWQRVEASRDRIAALSDRIGQASRVASLWWGAARAWVLCSTGVAVALSAILIAPAVQDGLLSGPSMALLVLLPLALGEVALSVADAGNLSARTKAAAERLQLLEQTPAAVHDTVPGAPVSSSHVELDRVTGHWPGASGGCSEVSLVLAPGERVALTGPSGSGKSTVAALLLRFLDPVEGEVRIGGTATTELSFDDVRRRLGFVDDDPHVFATTLVENVRLARPGAERREVEEALRRARLGEWLDALPDGLDTWLGDGHAQVSGGERARLGIARCLLARHPVLVLDEPAAHLDHATATELAREVLAGPRESSVLWITHEPVGLDLVDRVVGLDDLGGTDPLVLTTGEPAPRS